MIASGLVSVTFRQLSPSEIVALAVRAGLDAVEWGGDVHVPPDDATKAAEVGRLTRESGLRVASYGSYYRVGEGQPFEPILAAAQALGAPSIRVWSGAVSSASATEADRERVAADFARIADLAAKEKIAVACEFHDGTLTDDAPSVLAMLGRVGRPNVHSYWQPRHGKPVGTGLEEIASLAPVLSNLHVFQWWPTAAERHPLAEGKDRWRAFLQAAAKVPGDRFALMEFVLGDSPDQFLADAAVLRELIAEVG